MKNHFIENRNFRDPHFMSPYSTGNQSFYLEYPWHPYFKDYKDIIEPNPDINVEHYNLVSKYEKENDISNFLFEDYINIHLPSKTLIKDLELKPDLINIGSWIDQNDQIIFQDPSANEVGPSYGLIREDILELWLKNDDLKLIWLIGGEKRLFGTNFSGHHGSLYYDIMLYKSGKGFSKLNWTEIIKGKDD